MTAVTENVRAGLVLAEANGHMSRENVVIASGQDLAFGTVVGKVTSGGKYAVYNNGAGDGTQAAAGILVGDDVDATGGDKKGVIIVRDAEINSDLLDWGNNNAAGITAGKADLAALGIILRDGV